MALSLRLLTLSPDKYIFWKVSIYSSFLKKNFMNITNTYMYTLNFIIYKKKKVINFIFKQWLKKKV